MVNRRSVALPPNLERAVRRLQANLLTTLDRDISFTEALNLALAAAFATADLSASVQTERWIELLAVESEDDTDLADVAAIVLECIDAIADAGAPVASGAPSTARPARAPTRRARAPTRRAPAPEPAPVPEPTPPPASEPTAVADEPDPEPEPEPEPAHGPFAMPPAAGAPDPTPDPEPAAEPVPVVDSTSPDQPREPIVLGGTIDTSTLANPAWLNDDQTVTNDPVPEGPETDAPSVDEPAANVVAEPVDEQPEPETPEPEAAPETPDPEPEPVEETSPPPQTSAPSMEMIERLRQAIVGGGIVDPSDFPHPSASPSTPAPEPATPESSTPERARPDAPSSDDVIIAADPIVIPPADVASSGVGDDAPAPMGPNNPDYPGIDPSQWETVEDTAPPPDSQKLSYDELAKALEEVAIEYDKNSEDEK